MAKVNVQLVGVDALLKKFKDIGEQGEIIADRETHEAADQIVLEAKSINARTAFDHGRLNGSITTQKIADAAYRIYTPVKYAPYVEFGTGRLTSIPSALQALASKFKGKGIKEVNLPARPFMYPAFIKEKPLYIKRLEKALIKLTKK